MYKISQYQLPKGKDEQKRITYILQNQDNKGNYMSIFSKIPDPSSHCWLSLHFTWILAHFLL